MFHHLYHSAVCSAVLRSKMDNDYLTDHSNGTFERLCIFIRDSRESLSFLVLDLVSLSFLNDDHEVFYSFLSPADG